MAISPNYVFASVLAAEPFEFYILLPWLFIYWPCGLWHDYLNWDKSIVWVPSLYFSENGWKVWEFMIILMTKENERLIFQYCSLEKQLSHLINEIITQVCPPAKIIWKVPAPSKIYFKEEDLSKFFHLDGVFSVRRMVKPRITYFYIAVFG